MTPTFVFEPCYLSTSFKLGVGWKVLFYPFAYFLCLRLATLPPYNFSFLKAHDLPSPSLTLVVIFIYLPSTEITRLMPVMINREAVSGRSPVPV